MSHKVISSFYQSLWQLTWRLMECFLDPLDASQRSSCYPFMVHFLKYLEMQNFNPRVLFGDLRRQFFISDVLKSFHSGHKSKSKKLLQRVQYENNFSKSRHVTKKILRVTSNSSCYQHARKTVSYIFYYYIIVSNKGLKGPQKVTLAAWHCPVVHHSD